MRRSIPFLFALTLLAPACDKDKDKGGDKPAEGADKSAEGADKSAENGGEAAEAGEAAETAILEAPPQIDEDIEAALAAIVENCEVNPKGCTVNNCANDEKKALLDKFRKKDGEAEKDRGAAVDTFAEALASDDPELQTAAVSVLYSGFRTMPETKVPPAAAMRLIEAWKQLPKYQANQSVNAVVHSAMLSGHPAVREALYAAIDGHETASKESAWRAALTYGRLDALPKLQEVAKRDDERIVVGALSAWRDMYEATDEEKAAICPWLNTYLGDERVDVFEAVGIGHNKCGGEYVAKLLDEGEKRLKDKHEFTRKHYFVFREMCHDFIKGEDTDGRKAECARNYTYLQAVVDDAEVESKNRALALDAIYYQRRTAETRELAQRYVKNSDPEIAEKAKEIVEKLTDK